MLYGRPYQTEYRGKDLHQMGEGHLTNYLIFLGKHIDQISKRVAGTRARGLDQPIHPHKPGDWIFVKSFAGNPLEEKWQGPFQVLLTTFTAVKIHELPSWIHYYRIKKVPEGQWWTELIGPTSLRLKCCC